MRALIIFAFIVLGPLCFADRVNTLLYPPNETCAQGMLLLASSPHSPNTNVIAPVPLLDKAGEVIASSARENNSANVPPSHPGVSLGAKNIRGSDSLSYSSFQVGARRAGTSLDLQHLPWIENSPRSDVQKRLGELRARLAFGEDKEAITLVKTASGKAEVTALLDQLNQELSLTPMRLVTNPQSDFPTYLFLGAGMVVSGMAALALIQKLQNNLPLLNGRTDGLVIGAALLFTPFIATLVGVTHLVQRAKARQHGYVLQSAFHFQERLDEIRSKVETTTEKPPTGTIFFSTQSDDGKRFTVVFQTDKGTPHLGIFAEADNKPAVASPPAIASNHVDNGTGRGNAKGSSKASLLASWLIPAPLHGMSAEDRRNYYWDSFLARWWRTPTFAIAGMKNFRVTIQNRDFVITTKNGHPLFLLDDRSNRAWYFRASPQDGKHVWASVQDPSVVKLLVNQPEAAADGTSAASKEFQKWLESAEGKDFLKDLGI